MAYTNIDLPTEYFNTVTYTGNDSTQSITGLDFQPDWVWLKERSSTSSNNVYDVIRGATNYLLTNTTGAEATEATSLTAFNSNGFSLGGAGFTNENAQTYVGWNWKANGSGVSNTSGTITSTVSANTTAGFSIVSYTGNGVSGATVGHGLGVAPKLQMIKKRNGTTDWAVVGSFSPFGTLKRIAINGTTAMGNPGDIYPTLPTSTVFSPGNSGDTNGNGSTYIAYSFAEIKGFSKFGAYTGNASTDGPFIYTGFKPAWIMIKQTSAAGESWYMTDNKRGPFNLITPYLTANESNAEGTANMQDYLSNGFKIRGSGSYENASGGTYIYMAFAENPFVSSTGIPTTAR
jgi:hypothetical protein